MMLNLLDCVKRDINIEVGSVILEADYFMMSTFCVSYNKFISSLLVKAYNNQMSYYNIFGANAFISHKEDNLYRFAQDHVNANDTFLNEYNTGNDDIQEWFEENTFHLMNWFEENTFMYLDFIQNVIIYGINFPEVLLNKFIDTINVDYLLKHVTVTESFIEKNIDDINRTVLFSMQVVDPKYYIRYVTHDSQYSTILLFQPLEIEMVEILFKKLQYQVDVMSLLSLNENLPLSTIMEYYPRFTYSNNNMFNLIAAGLDIAVSRDLVLYKFKFANTDLVNNVMAFAYE